MKQTLTKEELKQIDGYFRACNYISCASLYLKDNALLRRNLKISDIKSKLVGHWGSAPAQNFVYAHCNRVIKKYDLNMIFISGPGHAGQAVLSNVYLEGSYSAIYPEVTLDEQGLTTLLKNFSFPGGTSSHVSPQIPGSINEGGELGYSMSHALGAVLDNPSLIATVVIGDGEAETGPLATSWHVNKLINPQTDGVILPVLNLNGYKIANPTILARISEEELDSYLKGCGWSVLYVSGSDTLKLHEQMARAMDIAVERILAILKNARKKNINDRPMWPMIVLKTPKGWTGPKELLDKPIEGTFRAHQIPFEVNQSHLENIKELEKWLKSYEVEKLFDESGTLKEEYTKFIPDGYAKMGLNPICNGGKLRKELLLPDITKYAFKTGYPGSKENSDMMSLGSYLKDVIKLNESSKNFLIFGPDEALSNRLNDVFKVTNRKWNALINDNDEYLAKDGRVIDSFLSEHVCEGALEGYLLTGRHGILHTYESFSRIIDSMVSQHAKWLKVAKELPWRAPISSLNIILSSHCWQQDHNGYTHQDPGFLNHVMTKKASIARIYLPCDTNTLLCTVEHILQTKNYINVVVASKHKRMQWLSMEQAKRHTQKGIGIWNFASNDGFGLPDIVLACAGDTPTLEIMATNSLLREYIPNLKIRVVNIVDLMKLQSNMDHPHGLSDQEYNYIFTLNKPIIFAFHGYPNLIHELVYKRSNQNIHVRGYIEEGTITTPFDMRVQNKMDRYNLALLAIKYLPQFDTSKLKAYCEEMLEKHQKYIVLNGVDMDEVVNWKWNY